MTPFKQAAQVAFRTSSDCTTRAAAVLSSGPAANLAAVVSAVCAVITAVVAILK